MVLIGLDVRKKPPWIYARGQVELAGHFKTSHFELLSGNSTEITRMQFMFIQFDFKTSFFSLVNSIRCIIGVINRVYKVCYPIDLSLTLQESL